MATSLPREMGETAAACSTVDGGQVDGAQTPAAPGPGELRYMARQPILDARGRVYGYELLFRAGPLSLEFSGDGEAATRSVIDSSLIAGAERLTGGLPMFVNCTEEALLTRLVLVMPPKGTVLEILETIEPSHAVLEACRDLKARGYRLALDDFTYSRKWEPMLELADYVKVDFSMTTHGERIGLVDWLKDRPVRLVLERVETREDFELGQSEGFRLFQGYYFCRPKLIETKTIPANRIVYVEMLQALVQDPLQVSLVSDLVKRDASLTYRLLRTVNSPLYALHTEVRSIQGALVMIGDEMVRRVVMLAIACELGGGMPSELVKMAFCRGRFCELAAPLTGQDPMEQYLLGVLSLLPVIMNVPKERLVEMMPLRAEVLGALLGERNKARILLEWLEFYEQGQWRSCDATAQAWGLAGETLPPIYTNSLLWAESNLMLNTISRG